MQQMEKMVATIVTHKYLNMYEPQQVNEQEENSQNTKYSPPTPEKNPLI